MKLIYALFFILCIISCTSESITDDTTETITTDQKETEFELIHLANENKGNVFHLFTFHIALNDQNVSSLYQSDLEQRYDSVTWSISSQHGSIKIFEVEKAHGYTGSKLLWQWSHTFYVPGQYETYLHAYKNNEIVHSDTLTVDVVNEKDFLMYNWAEISSADNTSIGFENVINNNFNLCAIRTTYERTPGIELFLWQNIDDEDTFIQYSEHELYNYISSIYKQPTYDRNAIDLIEKYQELFAHQEPDAVPYAIWLTPKNIITLLKKENEEIKRVLVYAEPAE